MNERINECLHAGTPMDVCMYGCRDVYMCPCIYGCMLVLAAQVCVNTKPARRTMQSI